MYCINKLIVEDESKPWRKRVPFNLVGRGVAGIDEMREFWDDSKVYFGLLQIAIGSGSFQREKNVFLHFNSEHHPKPLQRSRYNKRINVAKELLAPYHAEITLLNKNQCTIDYVFHKLGHIFVSDNGGSHNSSYEVGSIKEEYKRRMRAAKKKSKEEKARLEQSKRRLMEEQEAKKKAEEDKSYNITCFCTLSLMYKCTVRMKTEAKAAAKADKLRLIAEEKERLKTEEEERLRIEEEERVRLELEAKAEIEKEEKLAEEAAAKKKKKRKRRKKRKKDDWSDDREWTGDRIVRCIHAETSPLNWGIFQPSDTDVICMAYGHGDLNDMRKFKHSLQISNIIVCCLKTVHYLLNKYNMELCD